MCDDQILINNLLANDMDIVWDQPIEHMRANHTAQGLPHKARTGKSQLTGQKIKIWSMDFAYRGQMFTNVCPGPDNWVAMPENHGKGLSRKNVQDHKLSFYDTWSRHCGDPTTGTKYFGLADYEQKYQKEVSDRAACLAHTLAHLPIGSGRKAPTKNTGGRDNMVFAHHYDAGNDAFWNAESRFAPIEQLEKAAPCSFWEVGAHTAAADSKKLLNQYPHCTAHAYEPIPNFFAKLRPRWENESRMTVHNYGLAAANSSFFVSNDSLQGESTFIGESANGSIEAKILSLRSALQDAGGIAPTLFHMNCEGMYVIMCLDTDVTLLQCTS